MKMQEKDLSCCYYLTKVMEAPSGTYAIETGKITVI